MTTSSWTLTAETPQLGPETSAVRPQPTDGHLRQAQRKIVGITRDHAPMLLAQVANTLTPSSASHRASIPRKESRISPMKHLRKPATTMAGGPN